MLVTRAQLLSRLVLILPLLGGCSDEPAGPSAGEVPAPASPGPVETTRPSLLLVTVDTLRREHLGCYGYSRNTTPTIDTLAAEGILFERALATMASTFPSHLSILTGLYAHQHDRTSNPEGVRRPFSSVEGCTSIARLLSSSGYRTMGVVSSRVLDARTGIGDGFDVFDSPDRASSPRNAREVTRIALSMLDELVKEEPFFLWVHYWDTHEPNQPKREYASLFETDEALLDWIATREIDTTLLTRRFGDDAAIQRMFLDRNTSRRGEVLPDPGPGGQKTMRVETGREKAPAIDIGVRSIADLVNRYDGDLRFIDDQIARLFERLRAEDRWSRTITVFTSDHGQSLGENGFFGHGFITNLNTFVPLVIRFPPGFGHQPRRFAELVSLVDVMPTVVACLDPEIAADFRTQAEGVDVLSSAFERSYALTQQSAESHAGRSRVPKVALLSERWKYTLREGADPELYDLLGRGEGVDVLADHGDVAREMGRITQDLLARKPELSFDGVSAESDVEDLMQNLRDLGYIGDE